MIQFKGEEANTRCSANKAFASAILVGAVGLLLTLGCSSDESTPLSPQVSTQSVKAGPDGFLEDYGVSCRVEVSNGAFRLTVHNDSAEQLELLGWGTPWDQNSDVLQVSKLADGEQIGYQGPTLNRNISEDSYIKIPAHGDATASYRIRSWYPAPASESLQVRLHRKNFVLRLGDREINVAHGCGSGVEAAGANEEVGESSQASLTPYPSCTATQKAQINRAIDGAMRAASLAVRDYENSNTQPILRWFGQWSLDPWEAYARMLNEDELVRCGSQGSPCSGNLGVVVDYFFDNKLYLCAGVWTKPYASLTAWEQQVGVLVHELGHLVDNPAGSIVDWDNPNCTYQLDPSDEPKCYGYEDALYLASCPRCAIRNADNYKFFAMQAYMRAPLFAALN